MNQRILIAGVGNIFRGDDAFGVEVVRQLAQRNLPKHMEVVDFGIRSRDLAYAMSDGYAAIILVDATSRGQPPGTLYVIRPDSEEISHDEAQLPDPHGLNPMSVLRTMRPQSVPLYLVGCEPEVLENEDGEFRLSAVVGIAVEKAIEVIETLLKEVLAPNPNPILLSGKS